MPKASLAVAAALLAAIAVPDEAFASKSRSRGGGEISRSDWGVSFKPPAKFKVASNEEKVVVLKHEDVHLLVRPAQVASVREARVYAKRGVHSHGFDLDADDLPEETKLQGHDAAAATVSGTDRSGKSVTGRLVTAVGPSARGVQIVAVGPEQEQDKVQKAMESLMQSVDFAAATSSRSGRKRR